MVWWQVSVYPSVNLRFLVLKMHWWDERVRKLLNDTVVLFFSVSSLMWWRLMVSFSAWDPQAKSDWSKVIIGVKGPKMHERKMTNAISDSGHSVQVAPETNCHAWIHGSSMFWSGGAPRTSPVNYPALFLVVWWVLTFYLRKLWDLKMRNFCSCFFYTIMSHSMHWHLQPKAPSCHWSGFFITSKILEATNQGFEMFVLEKKNLEDRILVTSTLSWPRNVFLKAELSQR